MQGYRIFQKVIKTFLDLIKAGITGVTSPQSSSYLMNDLKNATTPAVVLNIVDGQHKNMDNDHIMQALRSLFSIQKFGRYVNFFKQIGEGTWKYKGCSLKNTNPLTFPKDGNPGVSTLFF